MRDGLERISATATNVEYIEKNANKLDTFEYLVYLDTRDAFLLACDARDEDLAIKFAVIIELFSMKLKKVVGLH